MATRQVKITHVASILFLFDGAALYASLLIICLFLTNRMSAPRRLGFCFIHRYVPGANAVPTSGSLINTC